MVQDESGALQPFAMERIYDALPLLQRTNYTIDSCQLDKIIDSSNMTPEFWVDIASIMTMTVFWFCMAPTQWHTQLRR